MKENMPNLFDTFDLSGLSLPNRVVMSPMTRTRATEDDVATDLMRDYYVQRASAGLIITECTQISDEAHGIIRAPGIHRPDQMEAWRRVTAGVHQAGGRIYLQIWHCGRVAHPEMRNGKPPVAPSPIPAQGDFFLPRGRVDFLFRDSSRPANCSASRRALHRPRATHAKPASTASNCMVRTATCWISSCRMEAIGAPTPMAARSRTAHGCCSNVPRPP